MSEREQNGRAVFRVRIGPFTKRDDAGCSKRNSTAPGWNRRSCVCSADRPLGCEKHSATARAELL